MIGNYDNVNPSDVFNTEQLRQSELISRLSLKISEEIGDQEATLIQFAINKWFLDNDLHIVRSWR